MPNFTIEAAIMGLTTLSECDNVELTAVLLEPLLHPVEYKWEVTFASTGSSMTQEKIDAANEYFAQFTQYTTEVGLTMPYSLFAKECVLNVILYARVQESSGEPTPTSVQVKILESVPKAKFSNKASGMQEVAGDMPTAIPIIIGNSLCGESSGGDNSTRLLQTQDPNPVEVTFKVYSGTTAKPTSRGPNEEAIEAKINEIYEQYQVLSVNMSQGLVYGLNYRVVMTIKDLTTGITNTDELSLSFAKPAIKIVIEEIGNLVSIKKDVTLNGEKTVVPEPGSDTIDYSWKCDDSISYAKTVVCSCPVMTSSQLKNAKVVIPKAKLINFCKYSFSLTVTASSGGKKGRVASETIEFLAFAGTVCPANGIITPGTSNSINDIYFSFTLPESDVPDSNLTFYWYLVELVGSDINTTVNYTIVNTYMYDFLVSLGAQGNADLKLKDRPIPSKLRPQAITPVNARVLGLDADTLIPKAQYVFGVKIYYPDIPSFALVNFKAPQLPRPRIFSAVPLNGTGMKTQFSFMFSLPKSTGKDAAQYQIYRRDCPSSKNPASPVTQVLPTCSSYNTMLSPGDKSCGYQVEIILRAIEFDDYKEVSTIITVKSDDRSTTDLVSGQLGDLEKNRKFLTPNQIISSLNELANVPVPEPSAAGVGAINSTLNLLSGLDNPNGGMRLLMDDSKVPGLLNTTSSTMGKMLTTQTANVKPNVAGGIADKVSNYLNDSSKIEDGTTIIPSCVGTLSGVAGVGATTDSNSSFYGNVQSTLGQVQEMKLKESLPGSPSYTVSTKTIEVVAQSNYVTAFNGPQASKSEKGNEMELPGGLTDQIMGTIQNTSGKTNNTSTLATSMNTVSYNPYTNVKSSSELNMSELTNCTPTGVSPEQIAQMYKDLAKGNVSGVNKKEQEADIMQISFKPFQVHKNGSILNTSSSFDMGELPPGKEVQMGFPVASDNTTTNTTNSTTAKATASNTTTNESKDLGIPMYYNPENKTWVNKGCKLVKTNNSNKPTASCNHVGKRKKNPQEIGSAKEALSITIDLIKNVLNVLAAGNYAMLYSFGAFANASWECYFILGCVVFFLFLIAYLAVYFHKADQFPLFEERIITLFDMFEPEKEEEPSGLLHSVYGFFSAIKKGGMAKLTNKEHETQKLDTEKGEIVLAEEHEEFKSLAPFEIKRLKALFDDYNEHCKIMSGKQLFLLYKDEVFNNKNLTRLTHARLFDDLARKPQSLCSLLKVRYL